MDPMAQPPPYAPPSGGYPPQVGYPPQGGGYPPQGGAYPPQGVAYPPQGVAYPPPQQQQYQNKQNPGYPQQPPPVNQVAQHTTIITQQPAIAVSHVGIMFHEYPVTIVCPSCKAQVVSRVHSDVGTWAWVLCLILFFLGIWPCCLLPFCIDSCKDTVHTCPNCSVTLGVFRRM